MKSYTDLEQSKKLAEILPIESADMRYDEYISYIDGTPKVCIRRYNNEKYQRKGRRIQKSHSGYK